MYGFLLCNSSLSFLLSDSVTSISVYCYLANDKWMYFLRVLDLFGVFLFVVFFCQMTLVPISLGPSHPLPQKSDCCLFLSCPHSSYCSISPGTSVNSWSSHGWPDPLLPISTAFWHSWENTCRFLSCKDCSSARALTVCKRGLEASALHSQLHDKTDTELILLSCAKVWSYIRYDCCCLSCQVFELKKSVFLFRFFTCFSLVLCNV